jgi:hypothetical protein
MTICLPSIQSSHSGEGHPLLLDTWTAKRLAFFLIVVFALMPFYVIVTLTRRFLFSRKILVKYVHICVQPLIPCSLLFLYRAI